MCVKSVHIQGCRKVDFQMAETGNLQGKTGAFSASFDQKVPDLHKGFTRLEWSGKGFTRLDWWVREMVHQAGLMGPGNGSPAWLHGHGYTGMAVPVMATRAWLYPSWLYPSWLYRSPIMAVPLTHPSWLYRSPRHGCTGHWTGCTGHWTGTGTGTGAAAWVPGRWVALSMPATARWVGPSVHSGMARSAPRRHRQGQRTESVSPGFFAFCGKWTTVFGTPAGLKVVKLPIF